MNLETVRLLSKWPVLVEVFPRYQDAANPLQLILVDKQKHWEGLTRKGKVVNVAPGVELVNVGDVIYFEASAGFTLDGEAMDYANPLKGESVRFLRERECLAVEENVECAV